MNKTDLAEKIRVLRKSAALRQEDLAAKAGVSLRVIKDLETARGNPTLESLDLVSSVLGVSVSDLLSQNSKSEPKVIPPLDRASQILAIQDDLKRLNMKQLQDLHDTIEHLLNPIDLDGETKGLSSKIK